MTVKALFRHLPSCLAVVERTAVSTFSFSLLFFSSSISGYAKVEGFASDLMSILGMSKFLFKQMMELGRNARDKK